MNEKALLNIKQYFLQKKNIILVSTNYEKNKILTFRKQYMRARVIRYGKYFLRKDSKKGIDGEKEISHEEEVRNSFYVYNKAQKKRSLRFYKNGDLLFWGILDSSKVATSVSRTKQKYLNWFSFIERRLDNLLLRSNIINNPYYIRQCIINKMLLINKQAIINYTYSVKK